MAKLQSVAAVLLLVSVIAASAADAFSQKDILPTERAFFAERRKDNNHWKPMRVYPLEKFAKIMLLLGGSKKWDGQTGAAAVGALHAHPPGVTISLSGALDQTGKSVDAQTITLCYGNRLFWHKGAIFMVNENAAAWLDGEFPANRE